MRKTKNILNQFFDHIYVISLENRKTNRKFVDLEVEIFPGVDGSKLDLEMLNQEGVIDEKLAKTYHKQGMSRGQIGCAMAHRNVYLDIIEKGYQRVIILEDDSLFIKENLSSFKQALRELPENWEVLYLAFHDYTDWTLGNKVKTVIDYCLALLKLKPMLPKIVKNRFARPYSKHLRVAGWHNGTYAYAITQKGAKQLLDVQTPVHRISDHLLKEASALKRINSYLAYPPIFEHDFSCESSRDKIDKGMN